MRKDSAEAKKIQSGEHFLRTVLFNSVRVYAVSKHVLYCFPPTDSSNVKRRAIEKQRVVSLGMPDPIFALLASSLKQIRLQKSWNIKQFPAEQCVALYLMGIEQTTVYVDVNSSLVQIEGDSFSVAKNDRFLQALKEIIARKLPE